MVSGRRVKSARQYLQEDNIPQEWPVDQGVRHHVRDETVVEKHSRPKVLREPRFVVLCQHQELPPVRHPLPVPPRRYPVEKVRDGVFLE